MRTFLVILGLKKCRGFTMNATAHWIACTPDEYNHCLEMLGDLWAAGHPLWGYFQDLGSWLLNDVIPDYVSGL